MIAIFITVGIILTVFVVMWAVAMVSVFGRPWFNRREKMWVLNMLDTARLNSMDIEYGLISLDTGYAASTPGLGWWYFTDMRPKPYETRFLIAPWTRLAKLLRAKRRALLSRKYALTFD